MDMERPPANPQEETALDRRVREIVAAAPPLSPGQAERIAAILRGAVPARRGGEAAR